MRSLGVKETSNRPKRVYEDSYSIIPTEEEIDLLIVGLTMPDNYETDSSSGDSE